MIVKTNTGETVDLGQPENVRRGMVFRDERTEERFVAGRMVRPHAWARADTNGNCDRADLTLWHFLGCDPAHAERADCERFGIAPGIDAGAHGFARTRDGFAVDLRCAENAVAGMVLRGRDGETVTILEQKTEGLWSVKGWPANEWTSPATDHWVSFVGLDARHAHPEDVERLCCREAHIPPDGIHLQGCTLAIGDHDEHEDIATGTKWPANPGMWIGKVFDFRATRAVLEEAEVRSIEGEMLAQATVEFGEGFGAAFLLPPGALHIHGGGRHWMKLTADGILSCSCGSAKEHADNCDVPAWARADADVGLRVLRDGGTLKEAGAAVMARVERRKAEETTRGGFQFATAWWGALWMPGALREPTPTCASCGVEPHHHHKPGCAEAAKIETELRRKREAGLVELANAVPEGLDPVGWRAAVLALDEAKIAVNASSLEWWIRQEPASREPEAVAAYRRAVAPHKAPPPERKQRGPRLTVDDGRDE